MIKAEDNHLAADLSNQEIEEFLISGVSPFQLTLQCLCARSANVSTSTKQVEIVLICQPVPSLRE